MKKKGQIFEQFGGLATGIVALAILLVVAFLIMSEGKTQTVNLITPTTFTNETQTSVTFEAFTTFSRCVSTDEGISISELYPDAINWTTIDVTGNATVGNYNTINFSNKTGFYNSTTFNMTYSCKEPDEAYNSTETLQNATDDIPTWVPVIIIVFIGAILLGLVALLRRSQQGG